MEGSSESDVLRSLEELQDKIQEAVNKGGATSSSSTPIKKEPQPANKLVVSLFQLFSGILFLVVSLMAVQADDVVYLAIAALFFLIALVSLLPILSDVFTKKIKQDGVGFLAAGIILILGINYYLLWSNFLMNLYLPFLVLLGFVTLFGALFFLIHAYIAYLKRMASKEIQTTALLMGASLILLLASFLYHHFLLITIFFIVVLIFAKATADLTKRFMF